MIEELKPAHLAVDYIFTYRLWQDILNLLGDWQTTKLHTWDWLLSFETQRNLRIDENDNVYFMPDNDGNAIVIWDNNKAYARRET